MALSPGTRLGSYEIQSPLDLTDVNADGQVEVILEGDAYIEDRWIEVDGIKDGSFKTIFSGLGYYL